MRDRANTMDRDRDRDQNDDEDDDDGSSDGELRAKVDEETLVGLLCDLRFACDAIAGSQHPAAVHLLR